MLDAAETIERCGTRRILAIVNVIDRFPMLLRPSFLCFSSFFARRLAFACSREPASSWALRCVARLLASVPGRVRVSAAMSVVRVLLALACLRALLSLWLLAADTIQDGIGWRAACSPPTQPRKVRRGHRAHCVGCNCTVHSHRLPRKLRFTDTLVCPPPRSFRRRCRRIPLTSSDLQSCRTPVRQWNGNRLVEAHARRHRWMQTDSRRITHSINKCIRHAQIRRAMPPHTRLRLRLVPLQLLLPALLRQPLPLLRVLRPRLRLCFLYHRRATPVRP
jgi:hypothetical protein